MLRLVKRPGLRANTPQSWTEPVESRTSAFAKALAAGKMLTMIRKLEKMLSGSPPARTKRAVLSKMGSPIRKMRRDYDGTKTIAEAEDIAARHGI